MGTEARDRSVAVEPAQERFSFMPFVEMGKDLRRRKPHYLSDWTDGFHRKVLSSSLFMFFTSIGPAITFAALLNTNTEVEGVAQIGPVEVLLSTAITGSIFAIFGGQPLCIVGVTGPVTIFTVAVFNIAKAMEVDFLPFYCWIQIWSAIMHMALATVNACKLISLVTRYSCETFGMLIAVIYLYNGAANLIGYFSSKELEPALLSLVLGLGTAWLALLLTGARSWTIFKGWIRTLIADYGATAAVVFFCAVPYWGENYKLTPQYHDQGNSNMTIATLDVPDSFATTSGRDSWLINPLDCPVWAIFVAIAPALILTVLFFFDHNVSSLLCQVPEFGLKKGTSYHWDFFIIGLQILITGLLGIPPVNGLIPQAPLHTDSLCDKKFVEDADGNKTEVIVGCHEQRVSGLAQAVLIGLTLAAISVVGLLPIAALDGLFLYMGIASFGGNTFFSRLVLFFTDNTKLDARRLPFLGRVPMSVVRRFTLVQLLILVCIFTLTLLPFVAALFPVLIAVLVPLRLKVLPRIFGAENVDLMDAEGEAPPQTPEEEAAAAARASGNSAAHVEIATTTSAA